MMIPATPLPLITAVMYSGGNMAAKPNKVPINTAAQRPQIEAIDKTIPREAFALMILLGRASCKGIMAKTTISIANPTNRRLVTTMK